MQSSGIKYQMLHLFTGNNPADGRIKLTPKLIDEDWPEYNWLSVWSDKLRQSSVITHRIYSDDEISDRKSASCPVAYAATSGERHTEDAGL